MLSVTEASRIIGLSRQQTNTLFKSQKIPSITVKGKRFAYRTEVELFAELHKSTTWLHDCLISGSIFHIGITALYIKDLDGKLYKVKHQITDLFGIPFDQMSEGWDVSIYPIYHDCKKVTVVTWLEA